MRIIGECRYMVKLKIGNTLLGLASIANAIAVVSIAPYEPFIVLPISVAFFIFCLVITVKRRSTAVASGISTRRIDKEVSSYIVWIGLMLGLLILAAYLQI